MFCTEERVLSANKMREIKIGPVPISNVSCFNDNVGEAIGRPGLEAVIKTSILAFLALATVLANLIFILVLRSNKFRRHAHVQVCFLYVCLPDLARFVFFCLLCARYRRCFFCVVCPISPCNHSFLIQLISDFCSTRLLTKVAVLSCTANSNQIGKTKERGRVAPTLQAPDPKTQTAAKGQGRVRFRS